MPRRKTAAKKTNKNHSRAPNMVQTTIALPKTVLARIGEIAETETRSRNLQIQHFLQLGIREYEETHPKNRES